MPRHQPLLFSLLTIMLFINSSCRQSQKNKELIISMTKKLDEANTISNMSTATIMKSLEEKTREVCTRERAGEWYPKAQQVVAATKTIRDKIHELRTWKKIEDRETNNLIGALLNYRKAIEDVDSSFIITEVLQVKFIKNFFSSITGDSTGEIKNLLYDDPDYLKGCLTILETDIKIAENKLVTFCNHKVGCNISYFYSYNTIVGQNSNILKPGETLTISAGVGAYSRATQPVITINNNVIPLNEEAFSEYSVKAPLTPGNYSVPVTISFTDPQIGKPETTQVRIKYTVAKPCKDY